MCFLSNKSNLLGESDREGERERESRRDRQIVLHLQYASELVAMQQDWESVEVGGWEDGDSLVERKEGSKEGRGGTEGSLSARRRKRSAARRRLSIHTERRPRRSQSMCACYIVLITSKKHFICSSSRICHSKQAGRQDGSSPHARLGLIFTAYAGGIAERLGKQRAKL